MLNCEFTFTGVAPGDKITISDAATGRTLGSHTAAASGTLVITAPRTDVCRIKAVNDDIEAFIIQVFGDCGEVRVPIIRTKRKRGV